MNRALRARHALVWPVVVLVALAGLLFAVQGKPSKPIQSLDGLADVPADSEVEGP